MSFLKQQINDSFNINKDPRTNPYFIYKTVQECSEKLQKSKKTGKQKFWSFAFGLK